MGKELVRREMIRYRLMERAHVKAVALLEKECFSAPWSEDAIASELTNPISLWLVAEDGGVVVGYVGSQSVMDEADMMNIAVHPAFRRQGIARELVRGLVEALRKKNVHSLTLEVRVSNEPAKALYQSLGFVLAGRRPNYYSGPKEDALILRKEWNV